MEETLKVLVIEEEPALRRALRARVEEQFGFDARGISRLDGALDMLRSIQFCAVVARAEHLHGGPLVERLHKFGFHAAFLFFLEGKGRKGGGAPTHSYVMRIHFGSVKEFLPRFQSLKGQYLELSEPRAEMHERYRKIINRMSDGYWELMPDGTVCYANNTLKVLLGRDELRGVKAASLFPPRDSSRLDDALHHLARGILIPFELDVMSAAGELRKIFIDPTPFFDSKGKYLGSCAIITDITGNPRIEASVLKSSREFSILFSITSTLEVATEPGELLKGALNKILDQLNMDSGGMYLLDEHHGGFIFRFHRGLDAAEAADIEARPWAREFLGQVISREKKVVVVRDFSKDTRLLDTAIARDGYRAFALVPLVSKSQVIGVLWVLTRDRKKLDRDVVSLLISLGNKVGIALENVRYIAERLEQEKKQKQFSRDMIIAVTGGKLVLCEKDELAEAWEGGEFLDGMAIREPRCIADTRHLVEKVGAALGFDEERIFDIAISVSEVATNVVKHAGGGEITMQRKDHMLQIRIEDRGPGIDSVNLPKALLMKGFSTKHSLGIGYTIVLEFMDKVHLATSGEGTTIVMEMRLPCSVEEDPLAQFVGMFCDEPQ